MVALLVEQKKGILDFMNGGLDMSNCYNDLAFDKIMQQVEEDDKNGLLEQDIYVFEDRLGLHADDDRDEILFEIAEDRARELGI